MIAPSKSCKQCNNQFHKKPSVSMKLWIDGTPFCSKACYTKSQKGIDPMKGRNIKRPSRKGVSYPDFQGPNNPGWTRVEKLCAQCNTIFCVKAYRKDTAKCCSRECANKQKDHGLTDKNMRIRQSARYRRWRTAVYERDDYTCVFCGKRGGKLHADHIKPFSTFEDLRFEISNGRTLCVPCHRTTPTYGRRTACVTEA